MAGCLRIGCLKKNLVTSSFCMLKYIAIWRLYKGYTTFSDKPTKNEFPVSPITCFDLPCQLSFTLPAPSSWCIGPGDCSSFQPAPSSCRSLKIGSPSQKKKVVCHDDMAVCQKPIVPLVNIKIAGKWMFIPLKMVLYRYWSIPISW